MKNYIIKNVDGSEQSEMQAIHESRKEAGETLMDYICDHNEDLDVDDDDYLSPFDFALEEVECTEVNEVITDFESARKALGGKPNADFTIAKKILSGNVVQLEDVARLVTDINPKHVDCLKQVVHHRTGMEQGRWLCTRFLGLGTRQVVSLVRV